MITITKKVQFTRGPRGEKRLADKARPSEAAPSGRIPRVARLMALAIKLDRLLRAGMVSDVMELARLAHVTQPRITQILNLTLLAPDIQEQLLFLPHVVGGRDPINERALRPLSALVSWRDQRSIWAQHIEHKVSPLP